jgi:mannose-6-phosphate isomerase-like protein (cupin superfamily)
VQANARSLGHVTWRRDCMLRRVAAWKRSTDARFSARPMIRLLASARPRCRGAYVAEIGAFPPGEPGPPVHFHPNTDEAFYVADGEATFRLGDREHRVGAGGFVFIPRGTVHTVWNSGDGPVRGLIVISPGDAEHEFAMVDTK